MRDVRGYQSGFATYSRVVRVTGGSARGEVRLAEPPRAASVSGAQEVAIGAGKDPNPVGDVATREQRAVGEANGGRHPLGADAEDEPGA